MRLNIVGPADWVQGARGFSQVQSLADPALQPSSSAVPAVTSSYHTHTFRCKHASGDVVDYARAAATAGLTTFGAADHTPLPDNRWLAVRMTIDQLPAYEAAVAHARHEVPGLRVLQGMECDIRVPYFGWYRDTFLARGYDYLIGSIHFLEVDGREVSTFGGCRGRAALRDWSDKAVSAITSGLFACIGHPDNIACGEAPWNDEVAAAVDTVCAASAGAGVPLELNALGLRERRGYPWHPFWERAARHRCPVVLASDAHRPEDTAAGLDQLAAYAAHLDLRVVELELCGPRAAQSARQP